MYGLLLQGFNICRCVLTNVMFCLNLYCVGYCGSLKKKNLLYLYGLLWHILFFYFFSICVVLKRPYHICYMETKCKNIPNNNIVESGQLSNGWWLLELSSAAGLYAVYWGLVRVHTQGDFVVLPTGIMT